MTTPGAYIHVRARPTESPVKRPGEAWSFDDVYRSHYARLVVPARLMTGALVYAEEIVQEAFVHLYRNRSSVDHPLAYVRIAVVNGSAAPAVLGATASRGDGGRLRVRRRLDAHGRTPARRVLHHRVPGRPSRRADYRDPRPRRRTSCRSDIVTPRRSDPWAALGDRFVDQHYGSLRGRVRTHVIREHLRVHLAPPPVRIVDVGGGAGNQSIPLASDGYHVTIVDPSPSMLDRARDRAAAADVAQRVRLVEATGQDAPAALDGERCGGVLCHGVLMYLDDPIPLVQALAEPAGIVSIVAKNAEVMAMRPEASRRDPYRRLSRLFHLVGRRRGAISGRPDRAGAARP